MSAIPTYVYILAAVLVAFLFFLRWLGFIGGSSYVSNYRIHYPHLEEQLAEPAFEENGLAVYSIEDAPSSTTVLLFPYPHSGLEEPMVQHRFADTFLSAGYRVVSFDPPGALRSTRQAIGSMEEMLNCALEALELTKAAGPVMVAGHSMSSLCALAFAIHYPAKVDKLILVGSLSGFPAARSGYPGSRWKWYQSGFWTVIFEGIRIMNGRGSLADHKKYMNLLAEPLYHDPSFYSAQRVYPEDRDIGIPIRAIWPKNMFKRLDYSRRLGEISVPTLICAGRHDPETPFECSEELHAGITGSKLAIFESSGHMPFVEEPELFDREVKSFLSL